MNYIQIIDTRGDAFFLRLAGDAKGNRIEGDRVDERGHVIAANYVIPRKKVRQACRAIMHESHGLIPVGD